MTGTVTREERIARARAALASAELRTGARSVARPGDIPGAQRRAVDEGGTASVGTLALATAESLRTDRSRTGPSRAEAAPVARTDREPVAAGRGGAAPVTAAAGGLVAVPDPAVPPGSGPAATVGLRHPQVPAAAPPARGPVLLTDRPPLAVPSALSPLLPDGLRRGSTTAVLGSTSLVLAMIAAACTAREAWSAVVGQPSIGLLAAAQAGVTLERLAVVPHPGVDAPTVVAALLDGIDVVVVGPGTTLRDADRRRLMARARDRGSVLLSTAPWPGAGCVLTVEGRRWTGVGEGDGRLRAHELHITRTGRGGAGQAQDLQVVLPLDGPTDPYGLPVGPAPAVPDPATGATAGDTDGDVRLRLVG